MDSIWMPARAIASSRKAMSAETDGSPDPARHAGGAGPPAPMTETELVEAFENGSLPEDRLRHDDHIRLAWIYLRDDPLPAALERFSDGLKRFAAAKGKAGLYHETITWAYLLLINQRMERLGRTLPFEDFCASNPDLFAWRPSILDAYYRPGTLDSELARRVFVLPDRLEQDVPDPSCPASRP
jgi:hypothetical protein